MLGNIWGRLWFSGGHFYDGDETWVAKGDTSRSWITISYWSYILHHSADLITGNLYKMHHFHCFTFLNLTFSAKQLMDDVVVTCVRSVLEVPGSDLGRNAGHNTLVFRSVPQYFQANVRVLPQNRLPQFSSICPSSPYINLVAFNSDTSNSIVDKSS
jgi:hypothetical protein